MAKISIDCDGVLADFVAAAKDVANSIWPGKIPPGYQPTTWDFGDVLTPSEWKQVWAKINATDNFWLSTPAYHDNLGDLARFLTSQRDQDIWIVTARSVTKGMTPAKQTDRWIKACGLQPLHNYMAVITCEADDKAGLYTSSGIQYSIDDKDTTVEACDKLPNHKAFLLDRPWNQQAQVKRRVNSLSEYLDYIVLEAKS